MSVSGLWQATGGAAAWPRLSGPFAPGLARHAAIGLALLVAYVGLDWLTFVYAYGGLPITPWAPGSGLAFAVLLRSGPTLAPWFAAGIVLADLMVRGGATGLLPILAIAAIDAGVYALSTTVLARFAGLDTRLGRIRDVALLLGGAVTTIAMTTAGEMTVFAWAGLVPSAELVPAGICLGVGDLLGIGVIAPLLLTLWPVPWPLRWPRADLLLGAIGALSLALWISFGVEWASKYKFFHVMYLPVVGIAVVFGLRGACVALLAIQLAMLLLMGWHGARPATVTEFQVLQLALMAVGLLTGAVTSERRRLAVAANEAKRRTDLLRTDLAHLGRLATMSELTAAIAHELNQPLTAARAFTRSAARLLPAEGEALAPARQAMREAVEQIDVAGEVLHHAREFVRKGSLSLAAVPLPALLQDTAALMRADLAKHGVSVETALAPELPPAFADRIQLLQVLVNLLRNALESLRGLPPERRRILVAAVATPAGRIEVRVRDWGAGISPEEQATLFEPFHSAKPEGLGIGLSICRTIIEGHDGRLWLATSGQEGSEFRFDLPAAR